MKKLFGVLLSVLISTGALAQWQVPNNAVPVGKGRGVIGFGSATPGTLGNCFLSNGPTLPPTFRSCGSVTTVDVKSCGAVGNGSTDDKASIDACVAIVAALGGGTVFFPPGNYCAFAPLSYAVNNLLLEGAGPEGAVQISTCNHDINYDLLTLSGLKASISNMIINGSDPAGGILPTGNSLTLGPGCTECSLNKVKALRGLHAIKVTSSADITMIDIEVESSYGDSPLYVLSGAIHVFRAKLDQSWPITDWATGATIPVWAPNTAYAANAFVSTGGYIYQAVDIGSAPHHSAGTVFALAPYGVPITDGDITWKLTAPLDYSCLEFDSGSLSSFVYDVDCTGPYKYGFRMSNNFPLVGPPQNIGLDGWTFGGPLGACIYAGEGDQLFVQNSYIARCFNGIETGVNWLGDINIVNNRLYQNASHGIQLSVAKQTNIVANQFAGNASSSVVYAGGANLLMNIVSNIFWDSATAAVEAAGAASTRCNIGLNSSNSVVAQPYPAVGAGCTLTANN